MTRRLGFGLYEFQTIGPIGALDPNKEADVTLARFTHHLHQPCARK